jgi:hypothetical protein
VAFFIWTLVNWVSFTPIIAIHQSGAASSRAVNAIQLISRLSFAFFICSAVLLFEKFCIQWIARNFHRRSYAGASLFLFVPLHLWSNGKIISDRISDQKSAIKTLVVLYRQSRDISNQLDSLDPSRDGTPADGSTLSTSKLFKAALHSVKVAATQTTTALGNVASEIAGR